MKKKLKTKNKVIGNLYVTETERGKVIKGVIYERSYYNKRTGEQVIKVATSDEYEEIKPEIEERENIQNNYKETHRKSGMGGNWMKKIYGK